MKYENINANDKKVKSRLYKKKYDYSKFNYKVKSHVDFGKLFLEIHMAKFTAFDETCDASAVLNLLGKIPIFSLLSNMQQMLLDKAETRGVIAILLSGMK